MGMYDTYEGVQLKVGENMLTSYKIGDKTELKDGVYIGFEGAVVIKDGIFIFKTENVKDKWGGIISIDDNHPLKGFIEELKKKNVERKNYGSKSSSRNCKWRR